MIYAAAVIVAILLIGGLLWLLVRSAERRERKGRHRRGIRAGDGVAEAGAGTGVVFDSWSGSSAVSGDSSNWDSGSSGGWDSGGNSSCDSGSSGDSGGGGGGCD